MFGILVGMAAAMTLAGRSVVAINFGEVLPELIREAKIPKVIPKLVLPPSVPSFKVSDILSRAQYQRLRVVCDHYERVSKCLGQLGVPTCTVDVLGRVKEEICPLPAGGKEQKETLERLGKDTGLIQALVQILVPFSDQFAKCTTQTSESKSAK